MKRFILLLLCIPFSSSAQNGMFVPDADSFGIRSVTSYQVIDGEKKISRRNTYDTSGKITSWMSVYYYDTTVRVLHDTLLMRPNGSVSWPLHKRPEQNDSSVIRHWESGHLRFRVTTSWSGGKIVFYDSTFSDSIDVYCLRKSARTEFNYTTIVRSHYTYDEKGKVASREYRDSMFYGDQKFETEHSGYFIEHTAKYSVQHYYKYDGKKKYTDQSVYWFPDQARADCTVIYNRKGRVEEITRQMRDSTFRVVWSETTDRKGKPLSSYNLICNADSCVQQFYRNGDDPAGIRTSYYDKKGLYVKETYVDGDGKLTDYYLYEYEFY